MEIGLQSLVLGADSRYKMHTRVLKNDCLQTSRQLLCLLCSTAALKHLHYFNNLHIQVVSYVTHPVVSVLA